MNMPKIVSVESKEQLASVVAQYVSEGFVVADRSDSHATMVRYKEFNIWAAVLWFFFFVIGMVIYIISYMLRDDAEVIEIKIVQPGTGLAAS